VLHLHKCKGEKNEGGSNKDMMKQKVLVRSKRRELIY